MVASGRIVRMLEKGFGDTPAAVAKTVHLAAAAGLVGGSIEDATGDLVIKNRLLC
jgi:2-methylisocitrate lyase-like PEP mutase family enzyme